MAFVAPNREAGRILYQGTMDRARGIAGAVNEFVNEGYRRQEEEKEFGTKLKVTEAAINSFIKPKAAELGLTPSDIEAFMKRTSDESTKQYANRLGGFLEQSISTAKMNREIEQAKAQRDYTGALAEQARAAKAATDAATLERTRQQKALTGLEESLLKFTDYEKRAVAGTKNPLNQQEEAEYERMQNNPILLAAMSGRQAGITDLSTAVQLGQSQQQIADRRAVNEATAAYRDALNENKLLQTQLAAAKNALPGSTPKVGDTKQVRIGNQQVALVWNGRTWVDKEFGITHLQELKDTYGNVTGTSVNPKLLEVLGIKGEVPGDRPGSKNPAPVIDITKAPATRAAAPAAPAAPVQPRSFNTEAEAVAAFNRGEIRTGQTVIIGGELQKIEPEELEY